MLTAEQIRSFETDGFLVLEGFVPTERCERLRTHTEGLLRRIDPAESTTVFTTGGTQNRDDYFLESGDRIRFFWEAEALDGEGNLTRPKELAVNKLGHAMHDLDPEFESFSRQEGLAEVAHDIGLAEPLIVQSMYIFKQPGIGGEVALHNDHSFLWTEPMSTYGMWFALEDATTENGCLWALPGGHRLPQRARFRRVPGGGTALEEWGDPYPTDGLVPLEVPAGTLVLLDGMLPHGSEPNRSERSRHAYTLHLIDAGSEWPADNWLQRPPEFPFRGFRP